MVEIPSETNLTSYLRGSSDISATLNADQELTQYAAQRLADAKYSSDSANSSTSTDSSPFYKLRLAFVSPDGASHCVIEPPDPTQAQIQISWSFNCVTTQAINAAFQEAAPFLQALGNLKGAAVSELQQGNFAGVSVSGEVIGYYYAIMVKDSGRWKVIYKGQGYPSCLLMKQYDVPRSIYEQCL